MIVKKLICSIILSLAIVGLSTAQENKQKNLVSIQYANIAGDVSYGGYLTGNGYSLGYSRYIGERVYGNFNIGAYHYTGKGSWVFELKEEEKTYWNMNQWSLGVGYDLVKEEKLTVSGELAFLKLSNVLVDEIRTSGDEITFRSTRKIDDKTLLANIKGRYHISNNWMGMATLGYGFAIQRYKSTHLRIGIGYSF